MNSWNSFSTVEIRIKDLEDEECEVEVEQTQIPATDKVGNRVDSSEVERGWRSMIFRPMAELLGYPLVD